MTTGRILIPLAFDVWDLVDASATGYIEVNAHFTVNSPSVFPDDGIWMRLLVGERSGDDLVSWAGVYMDNTPNLQEQFHARADTHVGDGGFGPERGNLGVSGGVSWARFRLSRTYVKGMVTYEDAWISSWDANGSTFDWDPPVFPANWMLVEIGHATARVVLELNSLDITPVGPLSAAPAEWSVATGIGD